MRSINRAKLSELKGPKHWHHRAEHARADAEKATDRKLKRTLLGFAEGYDKLAKRIDKLAEK